MGRKKMSKELEAFENLTSLIDMLTEEIPISPQNIDWFYNIGDDIKTVEHALKRNEPMKIIQTSNEQDFSLFDCPNCDTTMYYESKPDDWKYCIECGQKLDWGDY